MESMKFEEKFALNTEQFFPGRKPVFFDIETTGLRWNTTHLYLVGLLFREEDGSYLLRQYFLRHPAKEEALLREVSEGLAQAVSLGADLLVSYNGDTFDLPYLRKKYAFYQMENPFDALETADIFRRIRPYRRLLCCEHLRQTDLEARLSLSRTDCCRGGDLISVYEDYLASGDTDLLDQLLLHNRDDIAMLPEIAAALALPAFFEGGFAVDKIRESGDELAVYLRPGLPFPEALSLALSAGPYRLEAEPEGAVLRAKLYSGERKLFFKNYRDYYYLPGEDEAIHKSVAVYADPSRREKASARTCYRRCESVFLPQPAEIFMPSFSEDYATLPLYARLEDAKKAEMPAWERYLRLVLKQFL